MNNTTLKLPATKGLAEIDFRDFATRLCSYNEIARKNRTRKARRAAKEERFKARALRGFFPQRGMKVERADTTEEAKRRGEVYFTFSNGMVVNASKVMKWSNPHLLSLVSSYLDDKEAA